MNRNVVRLNESQFRQIVKESAMRVLNELDWKTYANAARRDSESDNLRDRFDKKRNRSVRFLNAATDSFDKDFGYKDDSGQIGMYTSYDAFDGPRLDHVDYVDDNYEQLDKPRYFTTDQDFTPQNGRHIPGKWCVGSVGWAGAYPCSPDFETEAESKAYAHENGMRTYKLEPTRDLVKAKNKAQKEIDGYNGGKYGYDNEHGWHLNDEGKLNESIKRSIRKYLH